MTLQLKVPTRIKPNPQHESELIIFEFDFLCWHVGCLVNVPREGEEESLTFVKIDMKENWGDWFTLMGWKEWKKDK